MNSTLLAESDAVLDSAILDSAMHDAEVDLVEEMRLRTWARRNYVATCEREDSWHPVILDEMSRIDVETCCE